MASEPSRPNILFIMADQMIPMLTGAYGHPVVKTPNLDRLVSEGVRFDAAYCNSPACVPARAVLMSGRYTSDNEVYDNGACLWAEFPTFVHSLRRAGYLTCLSGKMHFIGPDQMHGFEERLVTNEYPADFEWTPSWEYGVVPNPRHTEPMALEYTKAKVVQWSVAYDYDEEVHFKARQFIRSQRSELWEGGEEVIPEQFRPSERYDDAPFIEIPNRRRRPFFLCVSYHHPHEPFQCTQELWDRYEGCDIEIPTLPEDMEKHIHPMDHWLNVFHGCHLVDLMNPESLYRLRRAYYANISYIDDKIGELIKTLEDSGLLDNTLIIFTSDHGDMLGERGMVQKRSLYEFSIRVPLIAWWPGHWPGGRKVDAAVSLIDLFRTFCELGGGEVPEGIEGHSLVPLLEGKPDPYADDRVAICESHGQGVQAACFAIRRGDFKYIYVNREAPQLYDISKDPGEWNNLAGRPEYAEIERELREYILNRFDPDDIERRVLASQRRRLFIRDAMKHGKRNSWDYQPFVDETKRFKR